MFVSPRPMLNKIPGLPVVKQENHIKDLTKLTTIELQEIKEREEKLLANKAKLNRLPDKGKRIQDFYERVQVELQRRANIDEAAAMFSALNIAERGQAALNELEWNGKVDAEAAARDLSVDVLDSDDENEIDPLRVIAQRQMHERRLKVVPPETQLITAEDLAEIKSFHADSKVSSSASTPVVDANLIEVDIGVNLKTKLQQKSGSQSSSVASDSRTSTPTIPAELEQHVRYLVEKTEVQAKHPTREKFMPYKTTLTDVHDPAKERERKQHKNWENTAATPPPIKHAGAKMLTLIDSVTIQESHLARLKKAQVEQAAKRLAAKFARLNTSKLSSTLPSDLTHQSSFITYRSIEGDQHINEDDEVHDPTDTDIGGGISYTVFE